MNNLYAKKKYSGAVAVQARRNGFAEEILRQHTCATPTANRAAAVRFERDPHKVRGGAQSELYNFIFINFAIKIKLKYT